MAKLSEKLLANLGTLDGEQITAATRVEIECIEDITDIVKTYLIGQGTSEDLNLLSPNDFDIESISDNLSDIPPIETLSKSYVDRLEKEAEEEAQSLPRQDICILQEGRTFIDGTQIRAQKRPESDTESVDSILAVQKRKFEPSVIADCDLHRTEDRSSIEVLIAQQRTEALTFILRIEKCHSRKLKNLGPIAYEMEQIGRNFHDKTVHKPFTKQFESDEESDEGKKRIPPTIIIDEVGDINSIPEEEIFQVDYYVHHDLQTTSQLSRIQENDENAEGGIFNLELASQIHSGNSNIRQPRRKFSIDSSLSSGSDNQPQPAYYDLQAKGQHLEGKSILRKMQRYDSETSIDYEERGKGGGITHVILIKKEAHGRFEVTIEGANIAQSECKKFKEIPDQRYENLEYIKTIDRNEDVLSSYFIEKRFCDICNFKIDYKIPELKNEQITVIYGIENSNINQRHFDAQSKIQSKRHETVFNKCSEFSQEELNQFVHVERKENDQRLLNADRSMSEPRRYETVKRKVREFSVATEHCAVLMESRGTLNERIATDWSEPITGR